MRDKTTTEPKRLSYRPDELAHLTGIPRSTLYELLRVGRIESVKLGKIRVIPASAVESLLNSTGTEKRK